MKRIWQSIIENRLCGLLIKETLQTLRDKHLLFLLIFPPTIQLIMLGAALDPGVHNIKLGVVDYNCSRLSRSLLSSITKENLFHIELRSASMEKLKAALQKGAIQAALVIPGRFQEDLSLAHLARVQVLLDGTDAYSARIAAGGLLQSIQQFNGDGGKRRSCLNTQVTVLNNPDELASWYFIPGIMGAMLTLTSTLVASAVLLREKESGTLEQLLMSPYSVAEIMTAKVAPIFVLLMVDAYAAVLVGRLVFDVPLRGSFLLFTLAAALYVSVGMGLGMMLATVCKTERQSHLVSFFVNIPVMQLSGAVVPFETMPDFLRLIGSADPLYHFTIITRGIMLKATPLLCLWQNLLFLAFSALLLFSLSLLRFRKQLS